MIGGARIVITVLTILSMFATTCLGAQELSAKQHLEVARKSLDQSSNKGMSKPELQVAIQHIKTAISLGLNYQDKAQASMLLAKYAGNELSADEHFEVGETLIEANHYDSHGATQNGMEQGIFQMKEAIRLNCSDTKRAYLILADAYDQMRVPPTSGSDADRKRVADRDQILRQLYQSYPDDLEVLGRYANRVSVRTEKIRAYRRMTELNPKLADPHTMLALFLIQDGKLTAGIEEGKLGIELEVSPDVAGDRANMLAQALTAKGCTVSGGNEWGWKMMDAAESLDIGIHNKEEVTEARRHFAELKKGFLAAFGKAACPTMKLK